MKNWKWIALGALWIFLAIAVNGADLILINPGNEPNDGLGDSSYVASKKVNTNFVNLNAEHYQVFAVNSNLTQKTTPLTYNASSNLLTINSDLIVNGQVGSTNPGNGAFNVRAFGAKGDGLADDTAAIQAAINAAEAAKNNVFIPAGVYIISSSLVVTSSDLTIQGVGIQNSILRVTRNQTGAPWPVILVYSPTQRLFNNAVRDLRIDAVYMAVPPDGVRFNNASSCFVENVAFYYLNRGLIEDGIEICHVNHCFFYQVDVGIYLTRQTSGGFGYADFEGTQCTWDHATNACIMIDGNVSKLTLDQSWMESTMRGLWITNRTTEGVEVDNVTLLGLRFQELPNFPQFLGGKLLYAQPSVVDNFIMNQLKMDHVVVYGNTAQTNVIEWRQGGTTGTAAVNDFNAINSSFYFMATNAAVIYSDDPDFNGSFQNVQSQGKPMLRGQGQLALDARAGSIKMNDTNGIAYPVVQLINNHVLLNSFPTNSNIELWNPDPNGNIAMAINQSNVVDWQLYHRLMYVNGQMAVAGNTEIYGSLSLKPASAMMATRSLGVGVEPRIDVDTNLPAGTFYAVGIGANVGVITNTLKVGTLTADNINGPLTLTNINSASANINSLVATNANIALLSATSGTITNLIAPNLTSAVSTIATANAASLNAGTVAVTNSISSPSATVTNLGAGTINASSANATSLGAGSANVTNGLTAGTITTPSLTSSSASVNSLNASSATITNVVTAAMLNTPSLTVGSATITNTLNAGTLNAGTSSSGSASVTNNLAAGSATITNAINAGTLNSPSANFGAAAITNTLTAATIAARTNLIGSEVVTNTLTAGTISAASSLIGSETVTNTLTAGTINAGTLAGGAATVTNTLTAGTVSSPNLTGGAAVVTNALNAGTITVNSGTVSNTLTAGTISARTNLLGAATVTNTLTAGIVSTPTNLVGSQTITNTLAAGTVNAGSAAITNTLTVSGSISSPSATAGTLTASTLNATIANAGSLNVTNNFTGNSGGFVGTLGAGSLILTNGNFSAGTTYNGNRVNVNLGDFIGWRDTPGAATPVWINGTSSGLAFAAGGGITRMSILNSGTWQGNGPLAIASTSGGDITLQPASSRVAVTGNQYTSGNISAGTTYAGARLNLAMNDFFVWRDDALGNNNTYILGTTNGLNIAAGGVTRMTISSNGVWQANGPAVIQSTSGQDITFTPASGRVNFGTAAAFDGDTGTGNTRFLLYDVTKGTMSRVSVGTNDSGGPGYKVLRVPN